MNDAQAIAQCIHRIAKGYQDGRGVAQAKAACQGKLIQRKESSVLVDALCVQAAERVGKWLQDQ